jgi:hypothetical protein
VIGAAIASVHIREAVTSTLLPPGWGLVWITFSGVAISAAGPIVYVFRRYVRRNTGYPRIGDRLWAVLGVPWVVTAPFRPLRSASMRGFMDLYRFGLWLSVAVASLIVLGVLWSTWVIAPPGRGMRQGRLAWTERVGLILAIAWPVQCGLGLVLTE